MVSKLYSDRKEERKRYAQVMSDLSKFKRRGAEIALPSTSNARPLDPNDDQVKQKGDVLS